jgi:Tol biopolymer transport system component
MAGSSSSSQSLPSSPWWPPAVLPALLGLVATACATAGGGPPTGSAEQPDDAEKELMSEVGGKAAGIIVWSSSREGNHDLFVMNTDGSKVHAITHGENVDWFPRFSPDGSRILFTRSRKGWVFERDANTDGKWDIFTVTPDGKEETKVVENASWGTWISNDEIVFARSTAIIRQKLDSDEETVLVDSAKVPDLDSALMQQPEMSKDGKYIAITLRGSKRETGIWDIKAKKWKRTGDGCQINWSPSGDEVYWVHPTGNGGSRVLHVPLEAGKATKSDSDLDALTLIDIPGRRSHEYFPQQSADGKWLVWAATQRGHDHDIADYEIYLWEVGTPPEKAARLTWHSGNDRWPDIFLGSAAAGSRSGAKARAKADGDDDEENEKADTKAVEAKGADSGSEDKADADESANASKGKKATKATKAKKSSKKRKKGH